MARHQHLIGVSFDDGVPDPRRSTDSSTVLTHQSAYRSNSGNNEGCAAIREIAVKNGLQLVK